jgi:Na+/H+ antiporter NhaA
LDASPGITRLRVAVHDREDRTGWLDSLTQFLTVEAAGGVVLLACTMVALLVRAGVTMITPFVVVALLTWLAFHESGVHATIAGVLLGLSITHW